MEKYFRNNNIIDWTLDDHQIIMHLEKGKYFGLIPVEKRIWELMEHPKTLDELITALLSEYEISENQCRQETTDFLRKAIIQNILQKHDVD